MATQGLAVSGSSLISGSSFLGSSLKRTSQRPSGLNLSPLIVNAAAVTQKLKAAAKKPVTTVKGTQRIAAKPGNGTITVGVKGSQFRASEAGGKAPPKILRR